MHRFSKDQERQRVWITKFRRENWQPSNNSSYLCDLHFDSSQYEKHREDGVRKLKPNAIPVLFNYLSEGKSAKLQKPRPSPKKRSSSAPIGDREAKRDRPNSDLQEMNEPSASIETLLDASLEHQLESEMNESSTSIATSLDATSIDQVESEIDEVPVTSLSSPPSLPPSCPPPLPPSTSQQFENAQEEKRKSSQIKKMGAISSSLSELSSNEYLKRLSSDEAIDQMDPFWNQLLSFSFQIPVNSSDAKILEESTESIARNFALNNCLTGNLRALIHNFLIRASELKASAQCEDNIFIWQTYNALFIIRSLCKYFVEHLSEELLLHQFDCLPPKPDGSPAEETAEIGSQIEEFINALVELIVDVPVMNFTYALHLETLNTLLVLLSIQMYHTRPANQFTVYRVLMQGKCSIHAPALMKALLWNYVNQEKCPPELYRGHSEDGGAIYQATAALASSLWSVVTLGMSNKPKKPEVDSTETLLSNQSLLFIMILANHCTCNKAMVNPYRESLFTFTDSEDSSSPSPNARAATFKLDLSKLYRVLCLTLHDDQTTLLLYLLIHQNPNMRAFILSRTNIDQLVMPLLEILYHTQERNSHHIYMGLIILLVLSEDDVFNKSVHELTVKNVSWFKERQLSEVSLGGLLILVVIRTIQYNMTRMRDKYLHTNCLAALANMSAQFTNLHSFVAQKIINLFSQLCKRHSRLVDQIRESAMSSQSGETTEELEAEQQDYLQDLSVLEEVLRMVLEIINSCLTSNLHHNPHLVYSLLHQKATFAAFRSHPTFQDIIQNLDTVISYFSGKLEHLGSNPSPNQVLQTIHDESRAFKKDRLKKFPELKFKYVEEESPEEFFIPYVWSLIYHSSNLYFNPSRILLFSLNGDGDGTNNKL